MARNPRRDLVAGITVGMVALPLALAFGNTSGMGAAAGLVTAIVAGVLAAVFGGSNVQVSGPTGAMTVVLVPIFGRFGSTGVLTVGVMAGVLLLVLAVAKAGRYMKLIPLPVIEGFTIGIAAVIALQQLPSALGVEATGDKVLVTALSSLNDWAADPQWVPPLLALSVALPILAIARIRPGLPMSLVAVIVVTLLATVSDADATTIGAIPTGLPVPSLPGIPMADLSSLLLPAIAVAALAALESLLSATVADAISVGERHDSNRELFGQGIANLASPLFGGIPATGAIARTAVNVRAGAHSRLAAITQSILLLLVVLVGTQFVEHIPLAALAGVLIATTIQMVEVSSLRALLVSTRGDACVLIVTALATVFLSLVIAVVLGLVFAGAYALHQVAKASRLDEESLDGGDHASEEVSLLD
ncbi:MAG TPA: SulP family inorganic anion transporter, partial [Actinomycetes bacterium]|nr:SulP family inorganic anion transporter [Actinomycetes bacterium]